MNAQSTSHDEIFALVRTCFAELLVLPEADISMESRLKEDLNVDSMFLVESGIALAEKFQMDELEDVIREVSTVRQLVEFISKKSAAKL
jgi:acyl carrier protein